MIYALTITIAAGVALFLVLGAGALVARRGGLSLGRWRWHPSLLGLLLLPLAALVLWRVFPALLFIPFVLPFFWRSRRLRWPFAWSERPRPDEGDGSIEGRYRPLDDR